MANSPTDPEPPGGFWKKLIHWFAPNTSNWWSEVVTDKTRNWVLIGSIISAIIMPMHANLTQIKHGTNDIFWYAVAMSIFFFLLSEIIMYKISNERRVLELLAWQQKTKGLNQEIQKTDIKFYHAYLESPWTKHAPPFALVIYIILISIGSVNIIVTNVFETWQDFKTLIVILIVIIIITIKFINDIVGLFKNYKKAKGLYELTQTKNVT